MIPFYLITGFLGSGKTTFLKKLLDSEGQQHRIAIIQNKFASEGSAESPRKDELPSSVILTENSKGSVFCTCQLNNFVQTVEQLIDQHQPESIFVESAGLTDPIDITGLLCTKSLASKVKLEKIICIADAVNYFIGLKTINRFKQQLKIADIILVNKCDKVVPTLLPLIENDIRKQNSIAQLEKTTFCNFDFSLSASESQTLIHV